jgi:hypothetical protein
MREICLSGSMSGNRNQNQVKPDCGDEAKANSIIHRETTVTAPVLDSTPDYTQMYGPPPNCKRFEVERKGSPRKCIRPLSGESLSGHSMMIRTCRSFLNPSVTRDAFECSGSGTPLDCCFVSFSPQQTFGISLKPVVVAVEKWKAFCAFQA